MDPYVGLLSESGHRSGTAIECEISHLQTSVTPTDFALPTGGRTWQTESIWITLAPHYDLHKHNPFAVEDGIPMLVFQTLRTNPRAAWAGTSVVGVISGVVAGYTFELSHLTSSRRFHLDSVLV